ncbi:hypothetical protein HYV69_00800 [Candidatus Uhrbacteria bacterium]|nr:hypothetical protein [Candidatus Uhrbacteria bacterium]
MQLSSFAVFLSILWFLVYWILGGVFFAVISLMRLGRVRKLRFSCLFSLWVLVIGIGAAFKGIEFSQTQVEKCLVDATNRAQVVTSVFGCGFSGVFGTFLIGAVAVTLGGFLIFAISRTKSRPWIVLEQGEDENEERQEMEEKEEGASKYF